MKLRLNKNQVVCCTSLEEVEQCFKIFKEFDTSASNDIYDLMMLGWKKYGNRVYFRLEDGELFYGDLKHPLYDSFQILTAQDFLTMHSEPFVGYFESDGLVTTWCKIINVLRYLDGEECKHYLDSSKKQMCYFIDKGSDIECKYLCNLPQGYYKCNLDHYLHLIEHIGGTTEMVEKPNELADIRKQLAESVERERIAQNVIAEKRKEIEDNKNSINELDVMCTALNKALDEAKVKADKWDAIPQITVVKGAEDRGKEVLELLKPLQRWDNRSNFAFYENPESLYYFDTKCSMCAEIQSDNVLYNIFISTQNITELPPLDEKEEVEEFWLRLTDHYVTCYKKEDGGFSCWYISECINIYMKEEEGRRYLPFTAETEKLIGTTDKPAKKYEFMGCKKYFNTDELIKQLKGENK